MVPLLLRHVLDDVGELGHLRGDERYVRVIRHPVLCGILGSHSSRATAREHPSLDQPVVLAADWSARRTPRSSATNDAAAGNSGLAVMRRAGHPDFRVT